MNNSVWPFQIVYKSAVQQEKVFVTYLSFSTRDLGMKEL